MIDAASGLATLEWSAEARKQVILADRLVVTKTDLSDAATVERLHARLRTLNPRATLHAAVDGELDPRCLIEAEGGASGEAGSRAGFVAKRAPPTASRASCSHPKSRLRGRSSRVPWRR